MHPGLLKRKRGPENVMKAIGKFEERRARDLGVVEREGRKGREERGGDEGGKSVLPFEEGRGWDRDFESLGGVKRLEMEEGLAKAVEVRTARRKDEGVEFDAFVGGFGDEISEEEAVEDGKEKGKVWVTKGERALLNMQRRTELESWKLSEPIGGRMINVDPVFAGREKYLIVANRTTLQIYSTADSLLTRTIRLKIDSATRPNARIVTYCLSQTDGNVLWVACSDGAIYRIDWTSGDGADQYWGISSTGCIHMTAASMESGGRRRDIVFTTEVRKDGGWRITANELAPPNGEVKTDARTIYTSNQRINFLKTANEGSVIVAASDKRVLIGRLRSTGFGTVDKIRYEFYSFDSTDLISSLDVRARERQLDEEVKSSKLKKTPVVDVVVGDVRGSIFIHNDLLANLIRSQAGTLPPGISLIPRKLHWHRQAVQTVKWSLDGNYVISGGSETVLVLWQLDTGKQQFLPHMFATIQNVMVSPSGTLYGVQLADNSAMVLSTAELKPITNIAGIQTCVLEQDEKVESQVLRLEEEPHRNPLVQRTPAVVNPSDPSRLLLGVGQVQEISPNKPISITVPYLQTFDLGSGRNASRQALTRTNTTNINIAPNAHRISEPRVTLMKISPDGKWLVTVDEWMPPARDLDFLAHQGSDIEAERRRRLEVYLKFWLWNKETDTWELASRIDAPHSMTGVTCKVLDLAADHESSRFATIGEDNTVRVWFTKIRKRDGVVVRGKDGKSFQNWHCQHAISLGKPTLPGDVEQSHRAVPLTGSVAFSDDGSVLAAACGRDEDNLLHLLDSELGTIKSSQNGLFEGDIVRVELLWKFLITVSDRILVHDLILDETVCSINLGAAVTALSPQQKQEMIHLAVDRRSKTFAVSLPARNGGVTHKNVKRESLSSRFSELVVFDPFKKAPIMRESYPSLITALIPAVGSEGYLVLDTAAEIRTVLRKGSQAITALAQSTIALNLDTVPEEEPAGHLLSLMEDEEGADELDEAQPLTPVAIEVDDDDEFPVVTQHQLSEIFDVGPAFAMPPLEEMFYQVAGLFASKSMGK